MQIGLVKAYRERACCLFQGTAGNRSTYFSLTYYICSNDIQW